MRSGFYRDDPYGELGYLDSELFRAVRLVVDTGIHHKKWTREQAIEYMEAHTASAHESVVSEIERYIVMPGQACAYKIGEIKMVELRDKARKALGEKFDLRSSTMWCLKNGSMPLNILAWWTPILPRPQRAEESNKAERISVLFFFTAGGSSTILRGGNGRDPPSTGEDPASCSRRKFSICRAVRLRTCMPYSRLWGMEKSVKLRYETQLRCAGSASPGLAGAGLPARNSREAVRILGKPGDRGVDGIVTFEIIRLGAQDGNDPLGDGVFHDDAHIGSRRKPGSGGRNRIRWCQRR